MLRKQVEGILNARPYLLKHFKILGSYSRNCEEVNDLDLIFDIEELPIVKSIEDNDFKISIIQPRRHITSIKGRIGTLPFEAYGLEKKYFPAASLLMRGPRSKYHKLKSDAEERGYYMTHFGLLPIDEALSTELQEKFCFESGNKILFETEDEYEKFIYRQPERTVKRNFNLIRKYDKDEYKYYTYRSVQIEPTTRCNASCVMCNRFADGHEMKFEEFCYILDKLDPLHVKFWGKGESLMSDDCYRMIKEMSRRRITIYLTTNFNLDVDFKSLTQVDIIYISLHTFDPENYKKITGLDISKVLSNIIEAGKWGLNIALKSVVSKYNENDIDRFKEICEKYKLKYILTGVNFTDEENKKNLQSDVLRRETGIYKRCIQPHYPNIISRGDIYRCCMRPDSAYLGNVFRDFDLAKYKIEALERRLPECKNCTLC